jgi:hypothetical protein
MWGVQTGVGLTIKYCPDHHFDIVLLTDEKQFIAWLNSGRSSSFQYQNRPCIKRS